MSTRRSRWHPTPTGKVLSPNKREVSTILAPILAYGYLTASHLKAFNPSVMTKHRLPQYLEDFFHEYTPEKNHLVAKHRPGKFPLRAYTNTQDWYQVTGAAHAYVDKFDLSTQQILQYGKRSPHDLDHAFTEAHFLFSFLEEAKKDGHTVIPWWEILDYKKCPASTRNGTDPFRIPTQVRVADKLTAIKPDNIFGLHKEGDKVPYKFFALEIDMATEQDADNPNRKSALHRKFKQYIDIFNRKTFDTHFGIPNLTVLIATERREKKIDKWINDLSELNAGKYTHILFKSFMPHDWLAHKPEPELWRTSWRSMRGTHTFGQDSFSDHLSQAAKLTETNRSLENEQTQHLKDLEHSDHLIRVFELHGMHYKANNVREQLKSRYALFMEGAPPKHGNESWSAYYKRVAQLKREAPERASQ